MNSRTGPKYPLFENKLDFNSHERVKSQFFSDVGRVASLAVVLLPFEPAMLGQKGEALWGPDCQVVDPHRISVTA